MRSPPAHTAALLVIGNEILSGKVRDENGPYLLKELRSLGVEVRRVEVVPDEVELIVDALQRCRAAAKHVFTSGGIGPTHDDVTIAGIALALGRKVVHHPELVTLIRQWKGERLNDAHLRLCEVPEGADVVWGDSRRLLFPAIEVDDVLILPGVPSHFVDKFDAIRERYRAPPISLLNLYLDAPESRIAALLTDATERFAGISIGSYPRFDDAGYQVLVTVESRDGALVKACGAFLRASLGDLVLRVDPA